MKSIRIEKDVIFDHDVEVRMPDGVRLMANVFRPAVDRPCPVVMSVTPYGKDVLPDWIHMTLMRLTGVRFGHLACSKWTGFEAPDPLFWTRAGFVVMQADVRGMHKSEGHAGVLTDQDAQDYYDLIEWAARQPWSSGAVGLVGVSYLCMSQWCTSSDARATKCTFMDSTVSCRTPWPRGGCVSRIEGRTIREAVQAGRGTRIVTVSR